MSVSLQSKLPEDRDTTTEMRDLSVAVPPRIEWSLNTKGGLEFSGATEEILGTGPGSDTAQEMEKVLAPVLVVLRSDTGWDDYQLERTYESPSGSRHLVIHCRRQRANSRRHVGSIMNVVDHRRVEEGLGDLIDRYRLLVEISPDMIVVHQDGIVRYMNPTGLAWLGAEEACEVVGQPLRDYVAARSFAPLLKRIGMMGHSGAVSSPTELTIITLDGRELLLEAQSARTTWDGTTAFQVFLRDHSERRRAEEAVRYQASLLAAVSDAVVAIDLSGRITGWNPAAADLYRRPAAEALGRQVNEVLGATSSTPEGMIRPGEVEHIRADRTVVAVRVAVAPLRDDMGQQSGEVAVCADQSYRLLAAAERKLAESRFTTVVTALSEGIVVMEADCTIRSINPAARALLGDDVVEGSNGAEAFARRQLIDAQGDPLTAEQNPPVVVLTTGSAQRENIFGFDDEHGRRHWWSVSCETLEHGADGEAASIVCSMTDITERRTSERRLTHAAAHDSLTGLVNRAQLLEMLTGCLDSGIAAAVLFVDLDRFKSVNDGHGHLAGDQVLCTVAARIREAVATSGTVGRLAGDEFVVVLPGSTETSAVLLAEVIGLSISQPIRVIDQREVIVTASIGIAGTAANEASGEALIGDADMAMYRAKQRGGACSDVFDGKLRAARSRRLEVAERLSLSVTDHQVEVYYQPIVNIDNGQTVGFEALARWTDGELGIVKPEEFIAVAEDNGLIFALGRHVLFQSCQQAATWPALPDGQAPTVSVNISTHQLGDARLPADVIAALTLSGIPPERLCLEITESVLMNDVAASIAILTELRSAGVRLVIDDFGTGYSSLSYLRRLPVDGLKIDRSFVSELGHTEDDAIVDAIIRLGHSLGLTVTAEGVETPQQSVILQRMGCDTAQGFLYGRPLPLDAYSPSVRSEVEGPSSLDGS